VEDAGGGISLTVFETILENAIGKTLLEAIFRSSQSKIYLSGEGINASQLMCKVMALRLRSGCYKDKSFA
jgi:hypothetical protein